MKRNKFPPRVFNDPEGSLRRATSLTHVEREQVANHMRRSLGGIRLPTVQIAGKVFPATDYRP